MASSFVKYPILGVPKYASSSSLPAVALPGDLAVTIDTGYLYEFNGSSWIVLANGASATGTVTTVSVVTANGVSGVVANPTTTPAITLTLGAITPASVAAVGTVTGSNLSGTNTGDVTIGTANGLSLVGQALSLGLASTSTTGALRSTDWNTFNGKQAALTPGTISTSTTGVTVGSGSASTVGPNVTVDVQTASTSQPGLLSAADWNTFNGKQSTISFAAVGSSPSANGGTISGGVITLQPADGTHPGLITTGSQTIAGAKTFSTSLTSAAFISSTVNPATAGILQLASTDSIDWRNNANGANIALAKDTSDQLSWAGTSFLSASARLLAAAFPILTGDVTTTGGSLATTLAATSNGTLTTLSALTTASSLVTVGTITSGTWSATTIAVNKGGTGQTSYTDGQLLIGNSSGNTLTKATLTAGTGISITNGNGSITITASGSPAGATASNQQLNLGLSVSVATNAMTIALKQADGSTDPASGSGAVNVGFRSSTATSGAYNIRTAAAAASIVIPSGASLGQTSAINQYVWVYLIDNAGTMELAVSGVKVFPDQSIQSSTTIGAGSTSGTTLYSTTGRSNVPVRLIGRLLVNETTAGTWASNTTDVVLWPTPTITTTEWASDLSWTWTGLGTVSGNNVWYKRIGDTMFVRGNVTSGTSTAVPLKVTVPTYTIDSTKFSNASSVQSVGVGQRTGTSTNGNFINGFGYECFYDGSDTAALYFGTSTTSNALDKNNASANIASGNILIFNFAIPIAGWSTYGP